MEKSGTGGSSGSPERAVLVAVDLGTRSRNNRAGVSGARNAAVCSDSSNQTIIDLDESETLPRRADLRSGDDLAAEPAHTPASPGLDADESMAEFRELVASAGGVVVAELMQHRYDSIRQR